MLDKGLRLKVEISAADAGAIIKPSAMTKPTQKMQTLILTPLARDSQERATFLPEEAQGLGDEIPDIGTART